MNREIKFRAWDVENKKMYYMRDNNKDTDGNYPYLEMQFYNDGSLMWSLGYASHGHIVLGTDDQEGILMQYTGLKDKNGIDIYEGDIILSDQIVRYYTLENKRFDQTFVAGYGIQNGKHSLHHYSEKEDFEVIGNIYENPELLNGGKNGG